MSNESPFDAVLEQHGELILATSAKVVASAVFVSGRDVDEAARNSAPLPPTMLGPDALYTIDVDSEREQVTLTLPDGRSRSARRVGDQGCIILAPDEEPRFTPHAVESALGDPSTTPWPLGDAEADAGSSPLLPGDLDDAVAAAFANPDDHTAAFVVVHRGQLVAERYGDGIDRDTQLESWSMGKSLTAALVGVLMADGAFELDDAAPVPAWQAADDPRREIRIRDLLQMSSGLEFSSSDGPLDWLDTGYPDHIRVYSGGLDTFDFVLSRPAEHPRQTVGRYRNCDPLMLGYLIQQEARERGEEYLTFPQRALFDRIGIRRQVLETDAHGNFLLTGFDYGTARNWARIGLLYLNDGVFLGERVLPAGFAEFCRTPAPAWDQPEYGGQCWLNGVGAWDLPASTMVMAGDGGQHVFVDPTHDLVIVRMGHRRGKATYQAGLCAAQREVLTAIERRS
ncbi:MAG: serine hydrolase [Actinomycetota bacterium]